MNRKSAVAMIEKAGGHYVRYPSRNTDFLVIGGLPLRNDGRPTLCLSKARELQKKGHSIQITTETEFLQTLGRQKEINELHHLYTATQLQHILGLSRSQLRYWLRIKLIQPTKLARRLALFDMQEVMRARALHNLIASGVKAAAIRHSLADMSQWLPDTQRMLILLERSDHEGSLRVRLPNGRTADTNGQLLLGLANPGETEEPLDEEGPFELIDPEAADRWFAAGVIAEETGKLDEAVDAYENALLAGGPHTETCFNLGNIFFEQKRRSEAALRFRQSVEIDPEFVEAWHNLGMTYAAMHKISLAIRSYRTALRFEPQYADAHWALAELYEEENRPEESRRHWQEYLETDSVSVLAENAREHLQRLKDMADR